MITIIVYEQEFWFNFKQNQKKPRSFVFTVSHLSVWNYGKSYLGNDVDVDDGKVPISFESESPQY